MDADKQAKNEIEEGTINLETEPDPIIARRIEINQAVVDFLEATSEKYGMKIIVSSYCPENGDMAIWKGNNVSEFDKLAFAKLMNDSL